MKNLYFSIKAKTIKDNVFSFLFFNPEIKKDVSPELALKYLAAEYNYSKYIDAYRHKKSPSLKRGNIILTVMQGKKLLVYVSDSAKVISFQLRDKFDVSKVSFIAFDYGKALDNNCIRGLVRTNSDFVPLKTY